MSSTDPPTSPSTATMANGTRYQVGSSVVSAPIGSPAMALLSLAEEPASSNPKMSRKIGATEDPNVVQPVTPRPDERRGRDREYSAAAFTQPSPKPVIVNTRAPMSFSAEPPGIADTVCQWILSATSAMNPPVSTAVPTVITACIRMIRSKPITPPATVSALTTTSAMTLVAAPPPHPRRSNTVAVARVARMISTVSQPTVSSQEIAAGSFLPRTPKAARLSTMVGADPRLPATAMNPQSRKETMMPTSPAPIACQNEMPKPSSNEP